eukprot:Gb_07690 [translate_table: standard]
MAQVMYFLLFICILAGGVLLGEGRIVGKHKYSLTHAKDNPSRGFHNAKRDYSRRVLNKVPSGPSLGAGHKYINGYLKATGTVAMAGPSHYNNTKKSIPLNKLPSGPNSRIGYKYTHHLHDLTICVTSHTITYDIDPNQLTYASLFTSSPLACPLANLVAYHDYSIGLAQSGYDGGNVSMALSLKSFCGSIPNTMIVCTKFVSWVYFFSCVGTFTSTCASAGGKLDATPILLDCGSSKKWEGGPRQKTVLLVQYLVVEMLEYQSLSMLPI